MLINMGSTVLWNVGEGLFGRSFDVCEEIVRNVGNDRVVRTPVQNVRFRDRQLPSAMTDSGSQAVRQLCGGHDPC